MNKKRLVGGEFLIDLAVMSFVMSIDLETFTDITNQDVINQLTDLKTYIRNPKSIKPVWVRLQDNDDYIVARGELSKDKDSNVFVIRVKFKGQLLTINVEFTQMLNEDSQPLDDYYIDSGDAGYNFVSQNNLSSIVDNQGNPRFIEGDIEIGEITGVSKEYAKWSLSGTHLLIVVCATAENGTVISAGQELCTFNVPEWIFDKIISLGGGSVDRGSATFVDENASSQNIAVYLGKYGTSLRITLGGLTFSAKRTGRIVFDLLIDTDAPAEEEIGD